VLAGDKRRSEEKERIDKKTHRCTTAKKVMAGETSEGVKTRQEKKYIET
jgi:hypothetical protein